MWPERYTLNEQDSKAHRREVTSNDEENQRDRNSACSEDRDCFAERTVHTARVWLVSAYSREFNEHLETQGNLEKERKPDIYSKWRDHSGVVGRCCGFCHHTRPRKRSLDRESKRFCATIAGKGVCHYHWRVVRALDLKKRKGSLCVNVVQPTVTFGRSCEPDEHVATDSRAGFERFRKKTGLVKTRNLAVLLEVQYPGECVPGTEENGNGG